MTLDLLHEDLGWPPTSEAVLRWCSPCAFWTVPLRAGGTTCHKCDSPLGAHWDAEVSDPPIGNRANPELGRPE